MLFGSGQRLKAISQIMSLYLKLYVPNLLVFILMRICYEICIFIDKDTKNIASGIDILKKTRPFALFEVSAVNYTCK